MASSACAIQVHHCSIKKAQQMNEILRQEYLHTLGIQSYYPRKKLAGAPLSTVMLTPESEAQLKPASRDEKAPSLVQDPCSTAGQKGKAKVMMTKPGFPPDQHSLLQRLDFNWPLFAYPHPYW